MLPQGDAQGTYDMIFQTEICRGEEHTSRASFAQRQKLEIENLRQESIQLEDKVSRLQHQRRMLSFQKHQCRIRLVKPVVQKYMGVNRFRSIAPRKPVKQYVWKAIARRQWEERIRAEKWNRELRSALEVEHVVRHELEQLRQRLSDERVTSMVIPRNVINEEDVFNDLLVRAENTLVDVTVALRGVDYGAHNTQFMNASLLRNDCETEAFVVRSNVIMPFCLQVVSKAIWAVLSSGNIKDYCYFHNVVGKSQDSVAHYFGARQTTKDIACDFVGKYVICQFKDAERITIIMIGIYKPLDVNGLSCEGIRCHQTTWIELGRSGDMGTHLRSQCRFTIEADRAITVGLSYLLFSAVQAIHETLSPSIHSILEKTLVEEDWYMYENPSTV